MFKKSDESKKKGIGCLTILVILFLLSRCGGSGDKDNVTTPSADDPFKTAQIVDVMNGTKTEKIGEMSVLKLDSKQVTDEFLINWVNNHVIPGNYDWAVIVYKDKGNDDLGVYALKDLISKNVKLIKEKDGSYSLGENTSETKNYTVDSENLIESKEADVEEAQPTEAQPTEAQPAEAKKEPTNYDSYVKVVAEKFIEEKIEKQKLAGFAPSSSFNVIVYSSEPIKDQDGNEYPFSYFVNGQYEEKGTGSLRDFMMCVAYKSESDIKNFNGYCLQYLNTDTNKYFNVVAKEYDVIEKLKGI